MAVPSARGKKNVIFVVLLQGKGVKRSEKSRKREKGGREAKEAGDGLGKGSWTFSGAGEDLLRPALSVFCIVRSSRFSLPFRKLTCVTTRTHMNRHSDKVIH